MKLVPPEERIQIYNNIFLEKLKSHGVHVTNGIVVKCAEETIKFVNENNKNINSIKLTFKIVTNNFTHHLNIDFIEIDKGELHYAKNNNNPTARNKRHKYSKFVFR